MKPGKRVAHFSLLMFITVALLISCVKLNNLPATPSNPNPADGADNVSLDVTLSWECSDPDGDTLKYDLYFGTSANPPLIAEDLTEAKYSVSGLESGTTYYWRVVANDPHGVKTEGPVWTFTTMGYEWKFKTDSGVYLSPAIGKDGTIYVGSWDHYLYAINPDGNLKWKFETGYRVKSSPAIGKDGTIYVGSGDNYLYAIVTDFGGLADSPWPMFHHDPHHTGRYGYEGWK